MNAHVRRFACAIAIAISYPLHAAADAGALLDTRGLYQPIELAGVQSAHANGAHTSLSLFRLDLDAEPVMVDEAGGMVEGRPSKRTGVGYFAAYDVNRWTRIDTGLAVLRARYSDASPAGKRIAGAVQSVVSLALAARHAGPWSGTLELRYVGPRALAEDNAMRASATSMFNARLGYRVTPRLQLELDGVDLARRGRYSLGFTYALY